MELKKEYAEIVEREQSRWLAAEIDGPDCMTNIALACQELADRPPKELTNDEVDSTFDDMPSGAAGFCREWGYRQFASAIIAAFIAKQREPQMVKFRAARCKDGRVEVFRSDCVFTSDLWEWLEPAQEFEVRI